MDESEELARLRSRVAQLEAELRTAAPAPARERHTWQSLAAGLLILLACLLAPLSVTSVWASTILSDTDQYVETVAPVADDPAVQQAIADEVTVAIMEALDIEGLTDDALDTLAGLERMPPRVADALPALGVPLTQGVESFTRSQAENVLASPQFAEVWDDVNRLAHTQVVALLEGEQGGALSAQDDSITLNLGPIIEQVKERLVDQGFTLAQNIPVIDRSFVLVESEGISRAQTAYSLLNTLGVWLPIIALVLLAAGVLLARDRRRALLAGALGVTVAMVVLGLVLAVLRTVYVETTPAGLLTPEAAGDVFDILVRFLRTSMRALAVLGLVVAIAAFFSGPGTGAVQARSGVRRGIGWLRRGADSAGLRTGSFGHWVHAHRGILRVASFVVGGLVLMAWDVPTAAVVAWVALAVVVALVLIEFLSEPAPAVDEAVPRA